MRTENIATLVTSVTNDIQSSDSNNTQLVTSITLVTEIKDRLKEKYDYFNKPDSIQDLTRLKINMRDYIINELNGCLADNKKIPQDEFIDRVIHDFCQARQWE